MNIHEYPGILFHEYPGISRNFSLIVTAFSVIQLTHYSLGASQGILYVSTITPNVSFEIRSTSVTEASNVAWTIVIR